MGAEQDASEGREADGPRVVGAAHPERDSSVFRRDRPAPAPWTRDVPPGGVPDDYVAKPVPKRAMSVSRLVVVALLVVILVDMFVGFVMAYAKASEGELPLLFASAIFTLIIEVVGWWVVHLVIARR